MFFSNSCFFANFRFFRLKTILKLWFTSNFRYQWIMWVEQQRSERCANFQYPYLIVSCIKSVFSQFIHTKIDQKRTKTIKNQRRREAYTVLKYRWNHEISGNGVPWTVLSTPTKKKLGYPCLTKRCVISRQKTGFLDNFSWFCHFRTTCNFINIPWMDLFVGFCGTA